MYNTVKLSRESTCTERPFIKDWSEFPSDENPIILTLSLETPWLERLFFIFPLVYTFSTVYTKEQDCIQLLTLDLFYI